MVLKYTFGVNFYELMHDLQVWTSHRVIPPSLPLVLDPDYKIPINLQNRTSLMDGRSDFKKGYTAEDGEWVWTMSELQTVNGKRAWGRIGQGKLVVCEDMVKLFEAMKHGLDGRSFDSCRALVVIHVSCWLLHILDVLTSILSCKIRLRCIDGSILTNMLRIRRAWST